MSVERPEPAVPLNFGEPTAPREAAAVILVRGGESELELLLVRRSPSSRLMPGVWVFPGGSVDAVDGAGADAPVAAARRELSEETGIVLALEAPLVPFARWITPEQVRHRYDTWFYLALAPAGAEARVDGTELVDHLWTTAQSALAANKVERLALVFPTIKQLERIAAFGSAADLLTAARAQVVEPIQPRLVVSAGGDIQILLPGERDPGA
jgi:8-oxo-dGTP pyrophosphatase MutT (NUDIX family)